MKCISLFVEEPLVRQAMHAMLRDADIELHDVPPCVHPKDHASCYLECCQNHPEPDLIIVEIIAPRSCSGIQSSQKLLRRWPGVKLLLISASPKQMWPGDAAMRFEELPSRSCAFLAKPFTVTQLRSAVDKLLAPSTL
jgi:DNA-binding NtrC family response regulator